MCSGLDTTSLQRDIDLIRYALITSIGFLQLHLRTSIPDRYGEISGDQKITENVFAPILHLASYPTSPIYSPRITTSEN